jgi:hypothetical protein
LVEKCLKQTAANVYFANNLDVFNCVIVQGVQNIVKIEALLVYLGSFCARKRPKCFMIFGGA